MDHFSSMLQWVGVLVLPMVLAGDPNVPPVPEGVNTNYIVFGYNDLGMHCMNQDFSEMMILPPYNTLHAQVIKRGGEEPDVVSSGVTIEYNILNNTTSSNKTNFWDFAFDLFGVNLAPDVGLTGNGLAGVMVPTGHNDWNATGIPVTPLDDDLVLDPYPLAQISVMKNSQEVARTYATVPVSWEISCNLCHESPGISVATDILRKHDLMHGTTLESQKPVVCGSCHAQAPLGTTGSPSLSAALHGSHAGRMAPLALENDCYACHPGFETNCQRDIHFTKGIFCVDCHGGMATVGNPARRPGRMNPAAANVTSGKSFILSRRARCTAMPRDTARFIARPATAAPTRLTPAVTWEDNYQALLLQGTTGVISKCTVCHTSTP
ncbi:MAG: hypothetical protein HC888_04840, partial [Candidatus Competibacteraceae bacterium]|nr:hypothetical protein [Candidatus Competibacteraceae bacterium]